MTMILHPSVGQDDFPALPDDMRRRAVAALRVLRDHPEDLDPVELHAARVRLDLTGCKSIRCGGESYDAALRVVYQEVGDDVLVLAVGPRMGSEVYQRAHERLHPQPVQQRRRRSHGMSYEIRRTKEW